MSENLKECLSTAIFLSSEVTKFITRYVRRVKILCAVHKLFKKKTQFWTYRNAFKVSLINAFSYCIMLQAWRKWNNFFQLWNSQFCRI